MKYRLAKQVSDTYLYVLTRGAVVGEYRLTGFPSRLQRN